MLTRAHLDAAVRNGLIQMLGHADANETATFSRQLEHIMVQTYDVKYPELKARSLIPVDGSVPTGAESFTFRGFDQIGEAKEIANYATDFPNAEVQGAEVTQKIVGIGVSYTYTLQDMRRAQMAGLPLEARKAAAARRVAENKLEKIAAVGTDSGIKGLTNAANILAVTTTTGAATNYWAAGGKTPKEILADVNKMQSTIFTTSKGVHMPDTLVLDTAGYSWVATTPVNVADATIQSNTSILNYILQMSPWLKTIEYWPRLDTAGASSKARIMMFERRPENFGLVIPQDFEQFAPQQSNLAFRVPCHMRCGGVSVHYPKSIAYMDGTQA